MAENRKHIRFPRISFNETGITKNLAIEKLEDYINTHLDDFYDDESLIMDYVDADGHPCSSTVIVLKGVDENNRDSAIVKIQANSDEIINTIPIEESDEAPEDKEKIWLSDYVDESGYTYDEEKVLLQEQVRNLLKKNKELEDRILRLEYILTGEYTSGGTYVGGGVIAGGDMLTNSVKYILENENKAEKPENAIGRNYAKDDTAITKYDIYLGDAPLFDYVNASLYCGVKYFLKPRFFNQGNEEVKNEDIVIKYTIPSGKDYFTSEELELLYNKGILKVSKKGNISIVANISDTKDNPIETTRLEFALKFETNEKPDYETYSEPNVKHVLTKTVESEDLLKENTNYLCIGEQVWCIGNNTLYIKAKASNGNIRLFPISGNGSIVDPDTGMTESTIFTIADENLEIETTDKSIIVDDEGYLILNGSYVDENGIIILEDKK